MDYSTKIGFIIAIGTLGMLILAVCIVLFVVVYQKKLIRQQITLQTVKAEHQHELLASAIDIQERERKRIALDLHDNIGALLAAVRLKISQVIKNVADEKAKKHSYDAKSLVDEAIQSTRNFSRELMPPSLEDFGLPYALEDFCTRIHSEGILQVHFQVSGEFKRLTTKTELSLFRIVQEIIHNIIKHAQASNVSVMMRCSDHLLELCIEDDGNGFSNPRQAVASGLGLKSIESRISLLHAKITYLALAKGSKVIVQLAC